MPSPDSEIHPLVQEHCVMLRHYAELQARCTIQMEALHAEVASLRAQVNCVARALAQICAAFGTQFAQPLAHEPTNL